MFTVIFPVLIKLSHSSYTAPPPSLVTPWGRKEKYYKYTLNRVIKKKTRSKNHLRKVHLNALIFVHLQGTFYIICLFYNLIK